ncbi:ABC transporter permease subunit [Brenneria goodwinii]|uniref:ABC transporter permease subunit n=1 Tax=Brenneria goodwinii TaxID=1109412 RepID=UPI000EF2371C|nr:ABC transporter permease subunit [Brenneria goodwinii]MCG8157551.1 ABC transporter permease subunit [Brenneria goodwinii]MCG8161964.1 ABC transporter permease subunit [Brenneria goodwinii]MCG8166761.1 ABC transporter permease subunit [Brenneria goodwinii]MCG8171220.1 ABC transporter permease subunit [Brenneria goodwinii]MCG8176303.1 ABC transporter permease subunit [Brenneria goodwinii]
MDSKFIDISQIIEIFPKLLENLSVTLYISITSLVFGLLLGLVLTVMQGSKRLLIKGTALIYIDVMRSTPLLLLIFLVFFGSKVLLTQLGISQRLFSDGFFAILAITLGMSAYFSEMMRSAYNSVDKGQLEAINSLAIPVVGGFIRIILPQATIIAIPNLGNLMINIVKLTSLVSLIGIVDVFGRAKKISNSNYGVNQLEAFISVIIIYWIINVLIDVAMKFLEKKYRYLLD